MAPGSEGPRFSRTYILRRRGWDHYLEFQASVGSDALVTAQARAAAPCVA